MGYFSVEQETIYFDRAALWTKLCAMPVYPQDGIGNRTAEQLHSFPEELINAQFIVKNWSAELAETGNVPIGFLK